MGTRFTVAVPITAGKMDLLSNNDSERREAVHKDGCKAGISYLIGRYSNDVKEVDVPTKPSIQAHRASHDIGICPTLAKTLSELARTIAQTMVTTPTPNAKATQIFSIREI